MWLEFGICAVIYVVLLVWLGLRTLRRGHGWLFVLGFVFPLLWIIGAFIQPAHQPA